MPNSHGASFRRVDTRLHVFALLVGSMLAARVGVAQAGSSASANAGRAARSRELRSKTILLVRSAGDESIMVALRAEIDTRRWRIVEARRSDDALSLSLPRLMTESGASAALRYNAHLARIELSAAVESGTIEEVLGSEEGSTRLEILALRTTETLRAHGLELGANPIRPADSDAAATQAELATPARTAAFTTPGATEKPRPQSLSLNGRELWLELAPGLLQSSGGWSATAVAWIGLRLELSREFSISTASVVPFASQTISASEGRAALASTLLGVSLSTTLLRRGPFCSSFGLGASVVVTRMHGSPQPGYMGVDEVVITQAPHMSLGFALGVHEKWQVFSSILGGVSIPRVSVMFADRLERTWGSPFASISLGVAMRATPW